MTGDGLGNRVRGLNETEAHLLIAKVRGLAAECDRLQEESASRHLSTHDAVVAEACSRLSAVGIKNEVRRGDGSTGIDIWLHHPHGGFMQSCLAFEDQCVEEKGVDLMDDLIKVRIVDAMAHAISRAMKMQNRR